MSSGWTFLLPRVLGIAFFCRQEWEQAEAMFQKACNVAEAIGAKPELARTYFDFARLNLIRRDREPDYRQAAQNLVKAGSVLQDLDMLPLNQEVSKLRQDISGSVAIL